MFATAGWHFLLCWAVVVVPFVDGESAGGLFVTGNVNECVMHSDLLFVALHASVVYTHINPTTTTLSIMSDCYLPTE